MRAVQSTLELDRVLEILGEEAVRVGLFESLMVALVDHDLAQVVVRLRINKWMIRDSEPYDLTTQTYPLHDINITPSVARTGDMAVIDGWDDRFRSDVHDTAPPDTAQFEGRTFYFIPLKVHGEVVAVLATASPASEKTATLDRIQSMRTLLDQIALVLHHAHVHEKAREAAEEIESRQRLTHGLHEIGRTILASGSLDEALDSLVVQIARSGTFRSLMVALVDGARGELTVARQLSRGQNRADQAISERDFERCDQVIPLTEAGVAGDVAMSGTTEIIEGWDDRYDVESAHQRLRMKEEYANKVAYFIPVKQEGSVVALLCTASVVQERAATERTISAMGPLLDQVAVAISHARIYEGMRRAQAEVEEQARLIASFSAIGRAVLRERTLDAVIRTLMIEIAESGYFRSLAFSTVDQEARRIDLKRAMVDMPGSASYEILDPPGGFPDIDLDSEDITAVVVREGERLTIEGWDDRFLAAEEGSPLLDRKNYEDKVSYFVPIKRDDQVIAVMATGSTVADRPTIEARIDAMEPLLDHVAVALSHAEMFERLSSEAERLDARVTASERENLALLRVSGLIQRLQTAEDMESVVRGINDEFERAGFAVAGMTIRRIIDADTALTEAYGLRPNGRYVVNKEADERAVQDWRSGRIVNRGDVEHDRSGLPDDYYEKTYSGFSIKVESLLTLPYDQGVIVLRSTKKHAFDEESIAFLEKIGAVLSVGVARIVDLERIDRSRRHEAALLGISQLCSNIITTDEIESLLRGTLELLQGAGIRADGLILHTQDDDPAAFRSWYLGSEQFSTRVAIKQTLLDLTKKGTRYRRNTAVDREELDATYEERARERYGVDVRATLEIPFGRGIFALVSSTVGAFTEDDVRFLERAAEVLAVGIARIDDLQRLDRRSREQEALLTISQSVADMNTSDSLHTILSEIHIQFLGRDVPVVGLALHTLVDAEKQTFETVRVFHDGSLDAVRDESAFWFSVWSRRETAYHRDLQKAPPSEFPERFADDMASLWRSDVRSMLIVPHSEGAMVLPGDAPNAFRQDDIDFAEQAARILSVGMARLQDLRDLEQRAHELAQEKDFSASMVQSMLEGFSVISPSGQHLDVNPALCHMTGFTREELIGTTPPYPYWPPESMDEINVAIDHIRDGRFMDYELTYVKKGGTRFPVVVTPSAVRDGTGEVISYIATVRDITSRKEMEAERIQTQRLRAAGELSAGICHNLNNILTGVLGPAQLLKMRELDDDTERLVDAIVTSARRATDIVQQLYRGTAAQVEDLAEVNLNAVIPEAVQAAAPRWKDEAEARGVQIAVRVETNDVPTVRGTEAQVHDIILNLLFNAVDALPEGGTITLSTRSEEGRAILEVADDGTGMDEETQSRIFEPFFTTKMDVGTGLGLATVYNTVVRWGGDVDVESTPGVGTTFRLTLMPWTGTAETQEDEDGNIPDIRGRIVVIDDDDHVSDFLVRALGTVHHVERARSGAEALENYDLANYDLAIIDLGMAGMSGDQVGERARALAPGIGTILISGWELGASDSRLAGFDDYLKKPFTDIPSLIRAAGDVIAKSRSRRPPTNGRARDEF